MLSAEDLMQLAIQKAREGMERGQSPFGCAIAHQGKLLSVAHNTVVASVDITAHAEVNALRAACSSTNELHLEGALVATTCEPCPMCAAALHWARVAEVHFGATIADAEAAGFNELPLPADALLAQGGSTIRLKQGLLRDECRTLFQEWLQRPNRVPY